MSKPREDHFEEFQGHTLLKHLILDKYLKAWANKLLQWGAAGSRIWFVDAFAGEGADKKGNPGSPLIAAKMAREVVQTLRRSGKPSDADIRIIAIEKNTSRFGILKSVMEPYAAGADAIARLHHGTLAEIIDDLMTEVGQEPALFFLDPFGVEGLLSELLRPALLGAHNEIFALFSDIGAVRLHAVLAASERDADREVMKVLLQRNLFVEEETRSEEEKRAEVARSTASLQATKVAARRILSGALGPERVRELDSTPPHLRDAKAVEMYIRLLVESGSRFVLPLRIRDESGNPKYHLVHASKSASGFQAMKEARHSAFGKSTLPDDVLRKMSFDTETPIQPVIEQVRSHFAGQDVRWTQGKNRTPTTVRGYALRHTPIFPAQMPELQAALKAHGFIKTAKPVTYAFPGYVDDPL